MLWESQKSVRKGHNEHWNKDVRPYVLTDVESKSVRKGHNEHWNKDVRPYVLTDVESKYSLDIYMLKVTMFSFSCGCVFVVWTCAVY
jgi:hypothetical protein